MKYQGQVVSREAICIYTVYEKDFHSWIYLRGNTVNLALENNNKNKFRNIDLIIVLEFKILCSIINKIQFLYYVYLSLYQTGNI